MESLETSEKKQESQIPLQPLLQSVTPSPQVPSQPMYLVYHNFEDRGRLGNQLFQISGLWCLSWLMTEMCPESKTKIQIVLRRNGTCGTKNDQKSWTYQSWFKHSKDWLGIPDLPAIHAKQSQPEIDWRPMEDKEGAHFEIDQKWILEAELVPSIHHFHGYFQTARLYDNAQIRAKCIEMFTLSDDFHKHIQRLSPTFVDPKGDPENKGDPDNKKMWCAVHVRRGDYETWFEHQSSYCLDWSYYLEALKRVVQEFPDLHKVIFFTENPHYVKQQILQTLASYAHNLTFELHTFGAGKHEYPPELVDLFLMQTAPAIIMSHSTFSWWSAYLNPKAFVVCPDLFFPTKPKTEQILLSSWHRLKAHWETPELNRLATERRQSLNHGTAKEAKETKDYPVYPCGFCLPESRIMGVSTYASKSKNNDKNTILADLIPGNRLTYRFGDHDEKEYRTMYQNARFALGSEPQDNKSGWDMLRYHDILANGCFPMIQNLSGCPESTMVWFPKKIIRETESKLLPWKNTKEQQILYDETMTKLVSHMNTHLSTRAHAKRICQDFLRLKPNGKVLMLMDHPGLNYLRELTLIGMYQHLGVERFVEYPATSIDFTCLSFSLADELKACTKGRTTLDEKSVRAHLASGYYDWVIYGKVGLYEMSAFPFFAEILKYRQKVAFLFGGDVQYSTRETGAKPTEAETRFLSWHRQFGPCFVRELV
jgi:hypothetical protein